MSIICNKWRIDGSQKPFVRIWHAVPVRLQAYLAQPVKSDQQSVYIQSVCPTKICKSITTPIYLICLSLNTFIKFQVFVFKQTLNKIYSDNQKTLKQEDDFQNQNMTLKSRNEHETQRSVPMYIVHTNFTQVMSSQV